MAESLKQELDRLNERYREIGSEETGRMLILERGSRMLEMRTRAGGESAFWTNPSALAEGSWNVGGDRTWLSPELDFHMDPQGTYFVPAELDPGTYRMADGEYPGMCECSQTFTIANRHTPHRINVSLRKRYSPLPNPLRTSGITGAGFEAEYSGYECETLLWAWPTVSVESGDEAPQSGDKEKRGRWCNSWSIMQVPLGGIAIVPTIGNPRPDWMYGPDGEVGMTADSRHLRIPFTGGSRFKLSLDALQSAGRFGYVRKINEEESSLLVRQFQARPSGFYPDYPQHREDYEGSCMQFFCDGGQLGGFGELEYHAPAIRWEAFPRSSADVSQVYYFVGPARAIAETAEKLLGIAVSE
jgi:hypothetical protein